MKKQIIVFLVVFLTTGMMLNRANASDMSTRLRGKILLQVELGGEAWYVNPGDEKRYFLGKPDDAFVLMRELGVGITNDDIDKIQIADINLAGEDDDGDGLSNEVEDAIGTDSQQADTDKDGYGDKDEVLAGYNPVGAGKSIDSDFARKQAGKILLQVEAHGEAWYVNPEDSMRYFLGRPRDAFNVMRSLGLGITNENLNNIIASDKKTEGKTEELISFPDNLEYCISFSENFQHPFGGEMTRKILGEVDGECKYEEEMPAGGLMTCSYDQDTRKVIAQYYRDVAAAESTGTEMSSEAGTKYTLNGKEVENPIAEAMTDGTCIISGYGDIETQEGYVKEKEINDSLGGVSTHAVSLISVETDKSEYVVGDFAKATVEVKYNGEPFQSLLVSKMSVEGIYGHEGEYLFSEFSKGIISGDAFLTNDIAFSYTSDYVIWPRMNSSYGDTGVYNYEFALYDCVSLEEDFGKKCDEITFGSDMYEDSFTEVVPLATISHSLEVK